MKDYLNPSAILSLQQFLSSFNQLPLQKLSKADQEALQSEITIQEISDAIISFPTGKAPGPDGSGIEFYKKNMQTKMAPLMLKIWQTAIAFSDALCQYFLTFKERQKETALLLFSKYRLKWQ